MDKSIDCAAFVVRDYDGLVYAYFADESAAHAAVRARLAGGLVYKAGDPLPLRDPFFAAVAQ